MAGARIRVSTGNFITAKPLGVRDGIDMQLTGEVRRVDTEAMRAAPRRRRHRADLAARLLADRRDLQPGAGRSRDPGRRAHRRAHKLIFLMETEGVRDGGRQLLTELSTKDAETLLARSRGKQPAGRPALPAAAPSARATTASSARTSSAGTSTARCCSSSSRATASGTMIASSPLAHMRNATIDDVGGILQIIEPLEEQGILVRRSRERLETEIERFVVAEHDNAIIGCAGLYAFPDEKVGELAALAVHPDFRREGYGEALMSEIEARARKLKLAKLFVLTTRASQWFLERGYHTAAIADLPRQKQALYNYQRKSQVYRKIL